MLGYGEEEDTDSHLSSSYKESGNVSAHKKEGGLGDAVYTTPHKNQVSVTFQNFVCSLTLTYSKLCTENCVWVRTLFSLFYLCFGAYFFNVSSRFYLVRLKFKTFPLLFKNKHLYFFRVDFLPMLSNPVLFFDPKSYFFYHFSNISMQSCSLSLNPYLTKGMWSFISMVADIVGVVTVNESLFQALTCIYLQLSQWGSFQLWPYHMWKTEVRRGWRSPFLHHCPTAMV